MNTGKEVLLPTLNGMDAQHRTAIMASFQSIKPAIAAAVAGVSSSSNQNTISLAAIRQQIAQLSASLAALAKKVDNLPSGGGSSATQRTFAFFAS